MTSLAVAAVEKASISDSQYQGWKQWLDEHRQRLNSRVLVISGVGDASIVNIGDGEASKA